MPNFIKITFAKDKCDACGKYLEVARTESPFGGWVAVDICEECARACYELLEEKRLEAEGG